MPFDGIAQAGSLKTAAQPHWDATLHAFLAHGAATPIHLAATLKEAPDFALAHAVKGLFCVLLGRREMMDAARDAYRAAVTAVEQVGATPREQLYVSALGDWLSGHPRTAISRMGRIMADCPTDALAVKLDHGMRFILGDSRGMRASLEKVLPAFGEDHPARGYILGCYSFALEETGDFAAALKVGHAALELAPDDAWGLHAVAHVHDMTADAQGGLDWLTGREAAWGHCNNFRYHVWWHKALMHLDVGQVDAVLNLYDHEIRQDKTDDYRDISNATSLLSRLELEGVDVGDRWEELAQLSADRTDDGCLIFADLHYLLALIGGKRDTAKADLIGRIHRDAKACDGDRAAAMARPGAAASVGLEAFGEGDYARAFTYLSVAHKTMQNAGGSHAQRDVFERIAIDAGIRAGRFDAAERLLADRGALRAGTVDGYAAVRHRLIGEGRAAAERAAG